MAEELGIKDTKEVITSMGDSSVLLYYGVKAWKELPAGATTAEKAEALGKAIAAKVMLDPSFIENYKDAFDGAGNVLNEARDLSLSEIAQIIQHMANVAVSCASRVKE